MIQTLAACCAAGVVLYLAGATRMMHTQAGAPMMSYKMKPLGCDPQHVKGMSEKLIVSHYENNYGGAVKRLNLITEQLAGLDFNTAPGFLINGLKREELIATNSMILHELFFDGLGEESAPGRRPRRSPRTRLRLG